MNKALTRKEMREWCDKAWSEAMSKFKFTPWFTGLDLPTRVGIYQRIRWNEDVIFYSYWDGELWWPGDATTSLAKMKYFQYRESGVPRWVSQILNWRGMIRD